MRYEEAMILFAHLLPYAEVRGFAGASNAINTHTTINAWVYILRCADGSYYTGSHRGAEIETRIDQHQAAEGGNYTRRRLPVRLLWCQHFIHITDAIAAERQIKGWSRKKKQALIAGDWDGLQGLSKRRGGDEVG